MLHYNEFDRRSVTTSNQDQVAEAYFVISPTQPSTLSDTGKE